MKNIQTGFIGLIILLIVALAATGGGVYIYKKSQLNLSQNNVSSTQNVQSEKLAEDINTSVGQPVITKIVTRTDSSGKASPVAVVNPKVLNDLAAQKYGNNSVESRKIINLDLYSTGGEFRYQAGVIQSETGSYTSACEKAKSIFEKQINIFINGTSEESPGQRDSGISIGDFRLDELKCIASSNAFVITIPVTLKDGTQTKLCVSDSMSVYGDVDVNSTSCIKKYEY